MGFNRLLPDMSDENQSTQPTVDNMTFQMDDLKRQSDDARKQKDLYGMIGNIGQSLADVPSAYELLHKTKSSRANIKGMMDSAAAGVEDPWEKQKKTYELYKSAKDNEDLQSKSDSGSRLSNAVRSSLVNQGVAPESLEGMSAHEMMQIHGDPAKLEEIKARTAVDFENQKKLKAIEHGYDMQKLKATKEEGTKLPSGEAGNLAKSDDALKDVLAFKNSANNMHFNNTIGKANVKRYIPGTDDNTNITAYENQKKAMMQKIGTYLEGGKLTDADFESKYLPMAPAFDDAPALKEKKMAILENMVKQRQNSELDSYGKAGYKVGNFSHATDLPMNPLSSASSDLKAAGASDNVPVKKEYNKSRNKTRITYADGTVKMVDGR
jgi:hypothetical protein